VVGSLSESLRLHSFRTVLSRESASAGQQRIPFDSLKAVTSWPWGGPGPYTCSADLCASEWQFRLNIFKLHRYDSGSPITRKKMVLLSREPEDREFGNLIFFAMQPIPRHGALGENAMRCENGIVMRDLSKRIAFCASWRGRRTGLASRFLPSFECRQRRSQRPATTVTCDPWRHVIFRQRESLSVSAKGAQRGG